MPEPRSAISLEQFTTFGDLLKYLRRRTGLTQQELAIQVGYSKGQVSRLEQNQRLPDLATVSARFVPALCADGEPAVARRLMELAVASRREDSPSPGLAPFKGLYCFDEGDANQFFGREALVANLLARLTPELAAQARSHDAGPQEAGTRFLAIVGASGSGKSSIVRAGLIAAMRWNPAFTHWRISLITPTAHPLEALATCLTREANLTRAATAAAWAADLGRDSAALDRLVRSLTPPQGDGAAHGEHRFLLVVDQFEELFTLCRHEVERSAFVDNLLTAAFDTDGPTSVILVLRADFYAHCATFPGLRAALARHQEYIGPMTPEELRRAIQEPARRGHWELEPGLVELLLSDVGDEPGALPLLSHALLETWHRRRGHTLTLSGYLATGGVRGAIAETAEAVFNDQLDHDQQAIACHIFMRLTELGEGTQDTRRRAALAELMTSAQARPAVETVLQTLAEARLITLDEDSAEVAHEALIREWPTLRQWLNQNREGVRLHRHLAEAAQDWVKLNRDPGALYRGARLAQAVEWAEWSGHKQELNELEAEFLAASTALVEREIAEGEAQRRRALEAAQDLAEEAQARRRAEAERAHEAEQSAARLRVRNQIITSVGSLALLLALLTGAFAIQARQNALEADRAAATAQAASTQAVEQARQTRSNLLASYAAQAWEAGQVDLSLLLNITALQVGDSVDARHSLLTTLPDYPRLATLRRDRANITSLAFSPDGRTLAAGHVDCSIVLWDLAARQPLGPALTGHVQGVKDLAFSPDGQRLASAGADGTVIVWDIATRQRLDSFEAAPGEAVRALGFQGHTLVAVSGTNSIHLWDSNAPQALADLYTGELSERPVSLAVSQAPNASVVAVSYQDDTVRLWDSRTRRELKPSPLRLGSRVMRLALSPDGKTLAMADRGRAITLIDAVSGEPVGSPLVGHSAAISSLAFSPTGKTLASADSENAVRLWDVASGTGLGPALVGHTASVNAVAFSPDGRTFASGGRDGSIILWDATGARPLTQRLEHAGLQNVVAFSPDGNLLAAGAGDGALTFLDTATWQPLGPPVRLHTRPITVIAFSPDGRLLATGSEDRTAILWDTATRQPLGPPLAGYRSWIAGLAFSPDSQLLAVGEDSGSAGLWDVASRRPIGPRLDSHLCGLAFSPDGRILASTTIVNTVELWDTATWEAAAVPLSRSSPVTSLDFSRDGQVLATGSADNSVTLWDTAVWQPLGPPMAGFGNAVIALDFNADGRLLAAGSYDGVLTLWDVPTRQWLRSATIVPDAAPLSVAFSPDGQRLAAAGEGTEIVLWDVGQAALTRRVCTAVARDFTPAEWEQYFPGEAYRSICPAYPPGQ